MTQISEREACTKRSWYMGGGIGLLVAFLMLVLGMAGLIKAIVIGALVAVIAGYLLMTLLCKDVPANAPEDNTRSTAAASVAAAPTASGSVSPATGTVPAGDAGIGAAERASGPVTPANDAAEGAAQSATVADTAAVAEDAPAPKPTATPIERTSETPVADTAAVEDAPAIQPTATQAQKTSDAPAAKPASVPEQDVHSAATAALDETPEASLPDTAPIAAAAPEPTVTPVTDSTTPAAEKPALLDAPRAEGADDLKRIGGIGPKMEQTLNELGIYHFDQLAGLNDQEIAWVDSRLRFKGRIERDNWIGQAKALADASESQS